MNPFYKNLALWLVITLMMVMLYNLFSQQQMADTSISYTAFLDMVDSGRVADVVIQGQELYVTDINRNRFKIYSPQDKDLINTLRKKMLPSAPNLRRRIHGTCPYWFHGFRC